MKKLTTILILMVICFGDLYSQELSDSLLIDFFNKTFNDYYQQRDSVTKDFYILKDSIPEKVTTDFNNFKLHLVDYSQAYPLIKKNKISALYWARYKQISTDTIDIVIGGWTVNFERAFRIKKIDGKRKLILNNYNFAAWCGGTLGYIPQGRFIYNTELKSWSYLTEICLIKEKREKYRNK
ncbi:MAG: hypothetical protein VB102_15015 [Paludibacter sp.]|nr:hypothetical protein [Paludibacter sp.]